MRPGKNGASPGFVYLDCEDPEDSVTIEDGRVVAIGGAASAGAKRLGCRAGEIELGRVNAHTHLYSGLAPLGMPAPQDAPSSFLEILERVWWRLDRALDAASLRAAARLYVAEALLAGTTTLVDHHESPRFIEGSLDVLADACHELGVRALLCYGATERNGGRDEGRAGLAECSRFGFANQRPLVRPLVGIHASFTVSDDTLREAAELCRELATVLHVHVAEDVADVRDAERRGYRGPLERLSQLGALVHGSILAHGVHLTDEEVHSAEAAGCWLVQNPRSNRGNRVGYPRALKAASKRVALGTDGYPADMLAEESALFASARAERDDLDSAARRPAAGVALISERFGLPLQPLHVGMAADLVVRRDARAWHVVVGGHVVVESGRLVYAELEAIREEAQVQASALWHRMRAL